ncbi:MAG: tRNA 2-thiouridine(34) synthase MnmA [Acutalibacteraceae bacterium]
MNKKVMLGISGGVDSAVSAYILNKSGYETVGVNCCFLPDENSPLQKEINQKNIADAKATCDKVGIKFKTLQLTKSFREKVITPFTKTYINGGTPNPCIECNRNLKFGELLENALKEGFDFIATGHYARIEKDEKTGRFLLKKGLDEKKDQSYVLYVLTQHQLSHTIFPLGSMTKDKVREIALENELINPNRPDSQDICFVPDGDYAAFIEKFTGKAFPQGDFVNTDGKVLGTHKGIIRYTVGQRKGLGLALPAPLYVKEKDTLNNRVILCDNESLFTKTLYAKDINLISCEKITEPMRVKAKVRYKHTEQWATVTQEDENTLFVEFDEPQRAIAKGQAVVLYDGDTVVGGGTIV